VPVLGCTLPFFTSG